MKERSWTLTSSRKLQLFLSVNIFTPSLPIIVEHERSRRVEEVFYVNTSDLKFKIHFFPFRSREPDELRLFLSVNLFTNHTTKGTLTFSVKCYFHQSQLRKK
jgi:hypothetical protein